MTEIKDRVSRALCDEWDLSFNHEDPESFDRLAGAAIAAMREPTPEMVEAGDRRLVALPIPDDADGVWRAMIDEMLK